ncbi:MAG: FAD-binding oxidoreductase [Rhodospirillales bacterium]|jgi:glycine/D-amino acid oxidase-like deaminating enzyme|nr:FAD-binding oxidoreductase [Rhodospirillales bacterium]MBT4038597.1 FAD-binding oxidoreductase [Rhodospirillales bacterium]MBT4627248.1 FAD-binding oxidoreductase [Rhodospirillales bacterium]MBT5351562.1 FAD-binding oxidoreductase [Rhodospirillales bacterium]MBT5521536.1 FAD-binding oxidoreductase [Rhodospirillales bacterium]
MTQDIPKQDIPKQADVVIIGGGIIGCSTAYYLAKAGMDVVVIEKNHKVAWEQSGRNWGFVRQLGRDPLELPMMMRSNAIWQGLEKELGEGMGWQQTGIMGMTDDEAVIADYEEWRDAAANHDLGARVLTGQEVAEIVPGMSRDWKAGVYVPNDGNADPELATDAIARGIIRHGGQVITNCAVTGIDTQAGRVSGVNTSKGFVNAGTVICAAGAWTSTVVKWLGVDLPQLRVRGTVARTQAVERIMEPANWTPSMGFVQRQDGCFTMSGLDITDYDMRLGDLKYAKYFLRDFMKNKDRVSLHFGHPFWRDLIGRIPGSAAMADPLHRARIGDPMPKTKMVNATMDELQKLFPQIKGVALKKAWAGNIELTPDMLPVIDDSPGPDGLIIVTGLSGHGFGIGPGVGATVAELASGKTPEINLSSFKLDRFAAGSWSEPYNLI